MLMVNSLVPFSMKTAIFKALLCSLISSLMSLDSPLYNLVPLICLSVISVFTSQLVSSLPTLAAELVELDEAQRWKNEGWSGGHGDGNWDSHNDSNSFPSRFGSNGAFLSGWRLKRFSKNRNN